MEAESLTLEQAAFMDAVFARLDRATMNLNEACFTLRVYDAEFPILNHTEEVRKARLEIEKDRYDVALETFLNVYDSICYYRKNRIFTDLMWDEIENAVEGVYRTYKKQIEENPAYKNIRWVIDQMSND